MTVDEGRKAYAARTPGRGGPLDLRRRLRGRRVLSSGPTPRHDRRPRDPLRLPGRRVGLRAAAACSAGSRSRRCAAWSEEFSRRPAAEVAGGVVGLVTGLVIAALAVPAAACSSRCTLAWPARSCSCSSCSGRSGSGSGQAKYEDIFGLFGMKPRATARAGGRRPRRRHQRADRRADRRPRLDRVHLGHRAVARRGPPRAAGDLRLVGPAAADPRTARARRAGGAPEGADGAVPAGRGAGVQTSTRRSCGSPASGARR